MKILVLLTLCLLCISVRSVQSKDLTLTFSNNFCPKGIKCLNSTSFAFCQNTDGYFALGKQIFTCPLGKECDDYIPNACVTQEISNKLKEDRRINFHINYTDQKKASKTNRTQNINVFLKINKLKPQTKNDKHLGAVTPNPGTNMPNSTVITTTEAENFDHSDKSIESGEPAERKTTTTESAETDESAEVSGETTDATDAETETLYDNTTEMAHSPTDTTNVGSSESEITAVPTDEPGSNESSEEEATQIPTNESVEANTIGVPITTESVEEETPNVSTSESIEEETPNASTTESFEEETPEIPINEPVEEETTDNPVGGSDATRISHDLADESSRTSRNKIKLKTQSIYSTSTEPSKRKQNEGKGFYAQFIRKGRKREHIEYATFVDLDYGSLADHIPSYLKKYSEIRMHSGGLTVVNKTSLGNLKSSRSYGIKFEGLLDNVSPGTFNNLTNLEWVKLNGHLLKRIESYVFTNLNMKKIELQDNMINYLAPNAFDNMPHLEVIDLTNNHLKEYDPSWFHNDHKLTEVIFSNNYLQKIPAFAFKNLDLFLGKIHLYFDQNLIEKVHRNVYFKTHRDARHLPNGWVNTFFLNSNKLHCVPEIVMRRTKHLSLEDNPLSCGCIRELKIEAQIRHGDNTTSMRLTKKSVKVCLL